MPGIVALHDIRLIYPLIWSFTFCNEDKIAFYVISQQWNRTNGGNPSHLEMRSHFPAQWIIRPLMSWSRKQPGCQLPGYWPTSPGIFWSQYQETWNKMVQNTFVIIFCSRPLYLHSFTEPNNFDWCTHLARCKSQSDVGGTDEKYGARFELQHWTANTISKKRSINHCQHNFGGANQNWI